MKSEIQITDNAEICRIDIEGTIGVPEEWQFEQPEARVATYEKFRTALSSIEKIEAKQVVVEIRSTGGDVNDALLIHDALRSLGAKITTRCYGYVASAATIIAQAGSEGRREISANALYLIHNASCATEGNAAELAAKIDLLHQTDARIAGVYAARSARPNEEFALLMGENGGQGRWLSPQQALEAGLADVVVEASAMAPGSLSSNIARGWGRLLSAVGLQPQEGVADASLEHHSELPQDRNVLHFDELQQDQRWLSAMRDGQKAVRPTTTKTHEDPSCNDALRSANDQAYADDAKRLRG